MLERYKYTPNIYQIVFLLFPLLIIIQQYPIDK